MNPLSGHLNRNSEIGMAGLSGNCVVQPVKSLTTSPLNSLRINGIISGIIISIVSLIIIIG